MVEPEKRSTMTHKPFDDLNIDFNEMLEQEPEFKAYCEHVVFDAFKTINPHITSTMWALFQSGMSKEAASYTLKQLIRFGGDQNGK